MEGKKKKTIIQRALLLDLKLALNFKDKGKQAWE